MDTCKIFDTANQIQAEFDGRFGSIAKLPLLPQTLAEECNVFVSVITKEQRNVQVAIAFLFKELEEAKKLENESRQMEIQEIIRDIHNIPKGEISI